MGEQISIFGILIEFCTFGEGVEIIEKLIRKKKPQLVVLANAHTLNLAYEQKEYKRILKKAALVLRDGTGVGWAAKRKGIPPLHNFVGTDFIPDFCKYTSHKGYRFFLLGSRPGNAEFAANNLEGLAPGVVVTGHHHGYFKDAEAHEIIQRINETRSDILMVAMGNPKQEIWIESYIDKINVPVCIGVGAFFDYFSGRVVRAPRWMLNTGMEWVFRLFVEPKRLWKRYLIGNTQFIIRICRELWNKRNTN
jgi:N-acetylglucosaminyldiphosphoundecaprenol N-acetyl-beta-D-mannosaminyltransferase